MRLIDADKIIKENEDEIQRLSKEIERLESGEADIDPYYADRKIKQYQKDIIDYKIENRILKRYETAYDVDKILKQLEEEREYSYADFERYAEEYGIDRDHDDWFYEGLKRAIEIVKGGTENEYNKE